MILPANINPPHRVIPFGKFPNGIRTSWMSPSVEPPQTGGRWLAVADSEDSESRCVSLIRRFGKRDTEIHLARRSGPDPADHVRPLAIALEVDWVCIIAERGMGLMSLFLRSDVERILRAAPCPVVCIPEFQSTTGERQSRDRKANPIHRILALIKFPIQSRRQVENAIAVAERFEAKLDLLGVDELLRNAKSLRPAAHHEAKRLQIQALKKELSNLADEVVPQRLRGSLLISVGFPLFHATTRWARELESHLVVLAAPTRLWTRVRRIDVSTERILHRVGCPVICIPEHSELNTRSHKAVGGVRQCNRRRDRHTPSPPSLEPVPKCKDLSGTRHESFPSTINRRRFDAYET